VQSAPVASRAAALREPVTVPDYLLEPSDFYVGFPRTHKLRATLAVPLIVREEVAGCLFAWMRSEPRVFTDAEVDFAKRMAATVALALENAQLFETEKSARRRAESVERRLNEELERTRVLLRASDELTTAENTDELLERLAGIVLDATGIGRVFINLLDTRRAVLTTKIATGGLSAPGTGEIEFERLSETSLAAIAESKTALLDFERPGTAERDRAIAAANQSRLVLFVPLVHQGEIVGHMSFDEPGQRYDFSARQVEILEGIAAQAAVVLQNLRLFEREHTIAETLQAAILSPPEQIDGLAVAHLYKPASSASNVGGDFYDLFALDERRAALLIGDVSGKGIDAAALTPLIRDGARAYLSETADPQEVFEKLNALAHRFTATERFATAFLGVLDRATGLLVHCAAGHPAPVVVTSTGARKLESQPGLLGAFEDMSFASAETFIAPGETIVLFTDGLTEARCGTKMFGETGVLETLDRLRGTQVASLPGALLDTVLEYSSGRLRDDVIILCVGRTIETQPQ
jgi:serine phosphatase RsbU (regulator of sigma subunit)